MALGEGAADTKEATKARAAEKVIEARMLKTIESNYFMKKKDIDDFDLYCGPNGSILY